MKPRSKTEYGLNKAKTGWGGALVLIFAFLFALLVCSCSKTDAKAAQAAFDRGAAAYERLDMDAAKEAFAECCKLDGSFFADAKQYLDAIDEYERLYSLGVAAFEKGDYNSAASNFLGIKNYLNSAEYLDRIDSIKADYENAAALYEAGEYLKAREAFLQLGDYGRSASYIANVDSMIGLYNEGVQLMNRSSYLNAARAFRAINTLFLNSDELIALCENRQSHETVKLGEYIYSYNAEYGGDVKIVSGNPGIVFDMKDSRGLVICGAMDESGVVRYISFCATPELQSRLGEAELNSAFAHCIRALNPELAEHSDILAQISDFTSQNGRLYGSMRVHSGVGADGIRVLTAEYEPTTAK